MEQKQVEFIEQLQGEKQVSVQSQTQAEPVLESSSPPKNKNSIKKMLLASIILIAVVSVGSFVAYRIKFSPPKQQSSTTPPITETTLQLKDEYVGRDEGEVAFLQNGKIWQVSKDLKKKMEYGLTETTEPITDFNFSPSGQQLYWLTKSGEFWRTNEKGEINPLVTKKQDMTDATQETFGVGEPFSYVKGKVTKFYLSPDGNYIAYETLEKYTGCCGSTSNIPVAQLRIMKSDGTNKIAILKPTTVNRELVFFDGWLPDSKNILFHYSAPDEPTQGSPFFEVGLNGNNPKKYTAIEYPEAGGTITVAGAAPVFSPDGERMAYVEGGVVGEGKIWIAKANGTEKKLFSDDKNLNLVNLSWSDDGKSLLVNGTNKFYIFNQNKEVIFQTKIQQTEKFENLISPDDKYLVGLNTTEGYKADKLFILDVGTKERKEFSPVNTSQQAGGLYIYPQFFSDSNKLYYLVGPNESKNIGNSTKPSLLQLWVIDTTIWKNYKIADGISLVKRYPSVNAAKGIQLIDGSIYKIFSSGERKLLIDEKETGKIWDYHENVSPDKSKTFLMVQGGISLYFLYYLPPDNVVAKNIGVAEEAAWSNNSSYIAYLNKPADAGPLTRLYVYDTLSDQTIDMAAKAK